MNDDVRCRLLDWDSAFFGRRIARLERSTLDEGALLAALAWCDTQAIDCLYFLAESDHQPTVVLAEAHNFQLVDVRLTFERDIPPHPPEYRTTLPENLRPAQAGDIPALRAIASVSHRDSRFYYDPNFPGDICDKLYATWIDNSCRGYADVVLVAEFDRQIAGYISCHLRGPTGEIGLIAVTAAAQGRGLGRRLVGGALEWFGEQGMSRVAVVTQGRNIRAQRLYQRAGFVTGAFQLWYHRWFERANSSENRVEAA